VLYLVNFLRVHSTVFHKFFFQGGTPNFFFYISRGTSANENENRKKKRGDESIIANCQTKVPAIFRRIFDIFRRISHYIYIYIYIQGVSRL